MRAATSSSGTLARVGLVSLFAILAVGTLAPLWRDVGWPMNHDNAFGLRTYVYARHLARFDLLPIWSNADASGFGSPMPLMYHKAFFWFAGLLAVAGASLKTADIATAAVMLVIGGTGLYATARALGAGHLAGIVAGCGIITANYTVTNWLVRGALAEFSGAMVVPWALYLFVRMIQTGRAGPGLGVTIGVLWLCHSVLAYYVGWLFGVTYVLLAARSIAPWSALHPRALWRPLLALAVILAPYLAAMAVLAPAYDFARILEPDYQPIYRFKPFMAYLWDTSWHFGRTASGLTVELDHGPLVLLAIGLGALVARGSREAPLTRRETLRPALPFLILAVVGLALQLPASAPFYARVPGAAYLQFPWRLLAVITPALIVASVVIAERVLSPEARLFSLGALAAWMIAGCGAFVPLQDPRIPIDPPQLEGLTFSSPTREYEPRVAPPVGDLLRTIDAVWADAACRRTEEARAIDEAGRVSFRTACARSAVLPLPIYESPLHQVTSSLDPGRRSCLALPAFPGVCAASVPSGEATVSVVTPRLTSLVEWAWRRVQREASPSR